MAILESFWKSCNDVHRIRVLLGFRANVGASHSEKKKIRNPNSSRILVKVRLWRNDEVRGLAVLKVPFSKLL